MINKKTGRTKKDEIFEAEKNGEKILDKVQTAAESENISEDGETENAGAAYAQDENDIINDNTSDTENSENGKSDNKTARFDELIKGEFKSEYEKKIKENLSRRFKETDSLKRRLGEAEKIAQLLADKYGLTNTDIDEIKKAVDADDGYIKQEAEKSGMSVDDLKYMKKLESENARLKRASFENERNTQMKNKMRALYSESEQTAKEYPDFDLNRESENPKFVALLKSGVDVKTAYEVVHHNDIMSKLVNDTARETQKRTAESMRSVKSRPVENGSNDLSAAILKSDVSKLTPEQRAEIAKRVARGENITF